MLSFLSKHSFSKLTLASSQKLILDKSRQFAWSNYLIAPYFPSQLRSDYLALHWFNHELTRTIESVKEPTLAHSKLDFWLSGI